MRSSMQQKSSSSKLFTSIMLLRILAKEINFQFLKQNHYLSLILCLLIPAMCSGKVTAMSTTMREIIHQTSNRSCPRCSGQRAGWRMAGMQSLISRHALSNNSKKFTLSCVPGQAQFLVQPQTIFTVLLIYKLSWRKQSCQLTLRPSSMLKGLAIGLFFSNSAISLAIDISSLHALQYNVRIILF